MSLRLNRCLLPVVVNEHSNQEQSTGGSGVEESGDHEGRALAGEGADQRRAAAEEEGGQKAGDQA